MNQQSRTERWLPILEIGVIALYVVVALTLIATGRPPVWVIGDAAFLALYLVGITVAGHLLLRRRWWLAGAAVLLIIGYDFAATALLPFRDDVLVAGLGLPLVIFVALTVFFFVLDRLGIVKMKGGSTRSRGADGATREP